MKKSYLILLVYLLVIVFSVIYFVFMQHFGSKGLLFSVGGKDRILGLLDILIIIVTAVSIFLLVISLLALKRTNDNRMLLLSLAFFFFSMNAFLSVLDNFFPNEFIYIDHASKTLDVLVIASFLMLIYSGYKRSCHRAKTKK
ncbi:MAG: hypothetical protein HZB67_00060 [Candidatus Aenigmarchaeota archaeon]|nr:hypothetical protein [Candidatus Aenigmarchaeota archaeon]